MLSNLKQIYQCAVCNFKMTKDETLLFRTYDSALAERGEAFWTPHSAFLDPAIAPGTARRASVEMRVLCLWA